jgi:hypothetical protein
MKRYRIARAPIYPRPRVVVALAVALMACPAGCLVTARVGPVAAVALSIASVVVVALLLVYVSRSGRLDVGADGLFVDMRDARRYVPFAELSDASLYAEKHSGKRFVGVLLQLGSGAQVKVPLGEDLEVNERRASELGQAVRAALAAYRERGSSDVSAALVRGTRSTEEWLRRLRAIGATENPGGHREAAVPRDGLWRVVEDPAADPSARAGAAVALAVALDGEERHRLRIAAEATVSPRLRVALEAAACDDEVQTVSALEAMRVREP